MFSIGKEIPEEWFQPGDREEMSASEERALHFTARSRARLTINECAIRIWQDQEN